MTAAKRLRVAFVTSWYPSTEHVYLGAFVREQAMAMARLHDVRVIAPRLTRKPGRLLPSVRSLSTGEPSVSRPPARFVWPRRLSWGSAADAFTQATGDTLAAWAAEGWVPDLIHAHTLIPAGWAAYEAGRHLSVPVAVTVHSSFVSQPVLTRSSAAYVRQVIGNTDALIAVSPKVADELVAVDPSCVPRLVPNMVDDAFFTPAADEGDGAEPSSVHLVGIGALIAAKRWDLLIEAVADQRRAGVSATTTIIGTGPELERLEALSDRRGLAEWVTFAGAQDREGVRRELRRADVLVHPSRYETFGVVLIEAMACGVPVIATRSGGPDWVVEPETGQLVDVDDKVALGDAIRRFAAGEVAYDPVAVRAHVIARFGIDAVSGQLDDLYEELVAGG